MKLNTYMFIFFKYMYVAYLLSLFKLELVTEGADLENICFP